MADHHNAKDSSKRNTYTHCLGRKLKEENTGKMQWGHLYRNKHRKIYEEFIRVLKTNGYLILMSQIILEKENKYPFLNGMKILLLI